MGLFQIEIAGRKTERKMCYYISSFVNQKENMKLYLHWSLQILLKPSKPDCVSFIPLKILSILLLGGGSWEGS